VAGARWYHAQLDCQALLRPLPVRLTHRHAVTFSIPESHGLWIDYDSIYSLLIHQSYFINSIISHLLHQLCNIHA
jgi:hypothetical protein